SRPQTRSVFPSCSPQNHPPRRPRIVSPSRCAVESRLRVGHRDTDARLEGAACPRRMADDPFRTRRRGTGALHAVSFDAFAFHGIPASPPEAEMIRYLIVE